MENVFLNSNRNGSIDLHKPAFNKLVNFPKILLKVPIIDDTPVVIYFTIQYNAFTLQLHFYQRNEATIKLVWLTKISPFSYVPTKEIWSKITFHCNILISSISVIN